MSYETLITEKDEGILTITINRPKQMNALNMGVVKELKEAVENEAVADRSVRVIIITGAGDKAFVAGADISTMTEMGPLDVLEFAGCGQDAFALLESIDIPVIAAVNGFALGGGTELVMACDIVIADENAKFGQPEINLGIIPGFGGTQRLPRLIGRTRAKMLIYTGDMIDAGRAYEMGLVTEVCDAGTVMARARALAKKLAAKPAFALGQAKLAIDAGLDVDLSNGCLIEKQAFAHCFANDDRMEGVTAFLEKRKASFKKMR